MFIVFLSSDEHSVFLFKSPCARRDAKTNENHFDISSSFHNRWFDTKNWIRTKDTDGNVLHCFISSVY